MHMIQVLGNTAWLFPAPEAQTVMPKVAPAGGHRKAPKLAKEKEKGSSGRSPPQPPPGSAATGASSAMQRQTEELQALLKLRGEELQHRDSELVAAGEQIVHLETKLDALQASLDEKTLKAHALEAELEAVKRCLDELNEKHSALRSDTTVLRSENNAMRRRIEATPGLRRVPDEACTAIRRAQTLEAWLGTRKHGPAPRRHRRRQG